MELKIVPKKITVFDNEKARWETSKLRDKYEFKQGPNLKNKQTLFSKKEPKAGFSDCAEEF